MFSLGITLESLGQPLREAVVTAAQAGLQGIVFDAVGPLGPDALGDTGRREVRHLLSSHLLKLFALRCPLRRGLEELEGFELRLERLRKAMQLSFDLGARLILLGIGEIPAEEDAPVRLRMRTALQELSRFGDRIGCQIALDAGLEPIEVMLSLVRTLETGNVGVSIDPATLLMEKQPFESTLLATRGYLLHSYARDAVPRRIDRPAREAPVGHGDIDWLHWLGTLQASGYQGAITIRQTATQPPVQGAREAASFLRKLGVGTLFNA